jgi:hypothetical protein
MTAAIEAAQAQYAAGGLPVTYISSVSYYHTPLSFSAQDANWQTTGPEQATLYCDTSPSSYQVTFTGASVLNTTLSAAAYPMDMETTLTSVTGVQVGDLVKYVNTAALWQADNRSAAYEGQLAKVVAISGSAVQLDSVLAVGMPSGKAARIYRPIKVYMRGIRFERLKINGSSKGVAIKWADKPVLENCSVINSSRIGLHLLYCYKATVDGGEFSGANLIVSEQLGYGILVESNYGTNVTGIISRECRRGLDFSGYDDDGIPSMYCKLSRSRMYGGGFAEDSSDIWPLASAAAGGSGSHGPSLGAIYDGNEFYNCYYGLTLRGRDDTARNNLFVGAFVSPIWVHHGGGLVIENNRYTDQYEEGTATPGTSTGTVSLTDRPEAFIHFVTGSYDTDKHLTVRGNVVRNVTRALIYLEVTVADQAIANWLVYDNSVGIGASAAGICGVVYCSNTIVPTNFKAWDNEVIAPDTYTISKYDITGAPATTEAEVRKISNNAYRLYIPDDKAARVKVGRRSGQISCQLYRDTATLTPRFNGFIRYQTTTSQDWGGSSGVTIAATALTGTTGTDGNTTMSYSEDSLYVENRSGAAIQMILVVLGGT